MIKFVPEISVKIGMPRIVYTLYSWIGIIFHLVDSSDLFGCLRNPKCQSNMFMCDSCLAPILLAFY